MLPLDRPLTAAFALVLATFAQESVGWPMVKGGSQAVADALVDELRSLGGEVVLNEHVADLAQLPPHRVSILDVTPRQLVAIAGDRLPARIRKRYESFRYGSGVFKMDWALDGPVPWAADDGSGRTGTVRIGGTLAEVASAEADVAAGRRPTAPRCVLFVQYGRWDPSRAPAGKETAWAYCHVPAGSTVDMTAAIERQVEKFAPGFRDRIIGRATHSPAQMAAHDENYIGGDVDGGMQDIRQLIFRPTPTLDPYFTGAPACTCARLLRAGRWRAWDGRPAGGSIGASSRPEVRRGGPSVGTAYRIPQ